MLSYCITNPPPPPSNSCDKFSANACVGVSPGSPGNFGANCTCQISSGTTCACVTNGGGGNGGGPSPPPPPNGACNSCNTCGNSVCALINGVCSKIDYCGNNPTAESQGAYAYCQDGNGPVYPLPGLNIAIDQTSLENNPQPLPTVIQPTDANGRTFFSVLTAGAIHSSSILNVSSPPYLGGHPLAWYGAYKIAATNQSYGNLTVGDTNSSVVVDSSCHTSGWNFTHCGPSWGFICNTFCSPNSRNEASPGPESLSNGYYFEIPPNRSGESHIIFHFSNCTPPPPPSPTGWSTPECTRAYGWACDPKDYSQPLYVQQYVDGVKQSSYPAYSLANLSNIAGVSDACGGNPAHTYEYNYSSSLSEGTHTVTTYGSKLNSNNVSDTSAPFQYPLGGSGVSFTCPRTQYGNADATCQNVTGWACDNKNYSTALTIAVYLDAPQNWDGTKGLIPGADAVPANTTTGNAVQDAFVASKCGGYGTHSFSYAIPAQYAGGNHTLFIRANGLNPGGQPNGNFQYALYNSVTNSDNTLSCSYPRPGETYSNCSSVSGWACDGKDYTIPLTAAIYVDVAQAWDPVTKTGLIPNAGAIPANISGTPQDALIAANCGGTSNHTFSFNLPPGLITGTHTLLVRANGLDATNTPSGFFQFPVYNPLNGKDNTNTCAPPPPINISGNFYLDQQQKATVQGGVCTLAGAALVPPPAGSTIAGAANGTQYPGTITGTSYTIPPIPNGSTATVTFNSGDPAWACSCPAGPSCAYGGIQATTGTQNFYIYNKNLGGGAGWWQTLNGLLYAGASNGTVVDSKIPATCTKAAGCSPFISTQDGVKTVNSTGFTMTGGGVINTAAGSSNSLTNLSEDARTEFVQGMTQGGAREDFSYFLQQYSMTTGATSDFNGSKPGSAPSNGRAYFAGNSQTIGTPWNVAKGEQIVVFVNGDVTVRQPIQVAQGGFVAFIVSGNITFANTLGNALPTSTTTVAEGVFIANNQIIIQGGIPAGDLKFVGAGTFVGWGGFQFPRKYLNTNMNNTNPTELFQFRPDFMLNLPDRMKHPIYIWQETN